MGFRREGEIGLAELVETLVALQPDADAAEKIAEALGLGWIRVQPAASTGRDEPLPDGGAAVRGSVQPPVEKVPAAPPIELQPVRRASLQLELTPPDAKAVASGPLPPTDGRSAREKPSYQPLFRDLWWRGLARAMWAQPSPTRSIDLRIIAKHLRTGRPLERLPWLIQATLRRGVVLILDRSESMQPFWRDESELVQRCTRVMGGPNVRAYWVETDPWAEEGARLRWLRSAPEHFTAQTPVVIVSDFELGREMRPQWPLLTPWTALLEKVKSAGAPLHALVPLARRLWPDALTEAIPNAVPWDSDTGTGAVRRSVARHA